MRATRDYPPRASGSEVLARGIRDCRPRKRVTIAYLGLKTHLPSKVIRDLLRRPIFLAQIEKRVGCPVKYQDDLVYIGAQE